MSSSPVSEPHVATFLEMLAVERGAAGNTLDSYRRDLQHFTEFLGRPISGAKTEEIRDYLADLDGRGMAQSTVARRLSALRQFYRYLFGENVRTDDPTRQIESPKRRRRLPKVLSVEEVERLLSAARTYEGAEGVRLVALMEMLYATGLRVTELLSLPHPVLRPSADFIVVRGKGGRERVVPLSEPAIAALRNYEEVRTRFMRRAADGKWLFPSRSRGGHLTRQRFSQLVKELAVAADIDADKVSPHTLRHAFASHMLANGADLRAVQKMLGHADISTTQIYTHVLQDRLRDFVEDHHPLAD